MGRENHQLLAAASHYLKEARSLLSGNPNLGSKTIGEITRRHKMGHYLSGRTRARTPRLRSSSPSDGLRDQTLSPYRELS